MNLMTKDVKVFVPAMNFADSFKFYTAMGWTADWKADDGSLAVLALGESRFYLQNYYHKDWANNFMMHITVEDAQAWYEHAAEVISEGGYKYARLKAPQKEAYGALVTFVWDPSGVLLHFAQFLNN